MKRLPKEASGSAVEERSYALLYSMLDPVHWRHHEVTGHDNGLDLYLEFVDEHEFHNDKLEIQLKGRRTIKYSNDQQFVDFDLEVQTVNYGLRDTSAFLLVVIDVENEIGYYECLQEAAIKDKSLIERAEHNSSNVRIKIPVSQVISYEDDYLIDLSKQSYKLTKDGMKKL